MKLIKPAAIQDAVLVSSNVVETAPAAYSSGATYGLGATASVFNGTAATVYTSRAAGNLGNTPSSSPNWWALTGTTYATYSPSITYAKDDIVTVVSANSHHRYVSLQSSNLNKTPGDAAAASWWLDMGTTNRWNMFDGSLTSQTINPGSIDVTLVAPGRIDSMALMNISTATVEVALTDATDGVVYHRNFSMISDSGILDWYTYFFEPIERLTDLVVTDLPPYYAPSLRVVMTDTAAPPACGACVIGLSKDIGAVQYGAQVGIQDYSIKQIDAFGNYTVLQRAFSKRANFTVWSPSAQTDRIASLLASYRATPIVYVGSELFGATAVYGFYKDFNIEISYPDYSVCTLEVEGLT